MEPLKIFLLLCLCVGLFGGALLFFKIAQMYWCPGVKVYRRRSKSKVDEETGAGVGYIRYPNLGGSDEGQRMLETSTPKKKKDVVEGSAGSSPAERIPSRAQQEDMSTPSTSRESSRSASLTELHALRGKGRNSNSESSSGISELFSPVPSASAMSNSNNESSIYPSLQEAASASSPLKSHDGDIVALAEDEEKVAAYFLEGSKQKCLFYSYPAATVRNVIKALLKPELRDSVGDLDLGLVNLMFAMLLWESKFHLKVTVFLGTVKDNGNEEMLVKSFDNLLYHLASCRQLVVQLSKPSVEQPDSVAPPSFSEAIADHFTKVYSCSHLLKDDFTTFSHLMQSTHKMDGNGIKGTHEPFKIGSEDKPTTHKYQGNLVKVKSAVDDWKSHECPAPN